MKTLRNLAALVAVVGISHSLAGTALASDWQPLAADKPSLEPLGVLSTEEMAGIEGGTYFAPLTRNQLTIAITAGVSFLISGSGSIFIKIGDLSTGAQFADLVVCKAGFGLAATALGQSQISAGRIDERNLGLADVGLALGYGVGLGFLSTGCTWSIAALEAKAREVVSKKDAALANPGGFGGRRKLLEKWDEQDKWYDWAVDTALAARDSIETLAVENRQLKEQRSLCWATGALAPVCYVNYTIRINAKAREINNKIAEFKRYMNSAGHAVRERAWWIGMPVPSTANVTGGTYDIN